MALYVPMYGEFIKDRQVAEEFKRLAMRVSSKTSIVNRRDVERDLELGVDAFAGSLRPPEGYWSGADFIFSSDFGLLSPWTFNSLGIHGVEFPNQPVVEIGGGGPVFLGRGMAVADATPLTIPQRGGNRTGPIETTTHQTYFDTDRPGTYADWTVTSGTDHGNAVRGVSNSSDLGVSSDNFIGRLDSHLYHQDSEAPNPINAGPPSTALITRFDWHGDFRLVSSGVVTFRVFCLRNGIRYNMEDGSITGDPIETVDVRLNINNYNTDPSTGVAWTVSNLFGLSTEFGVEVLTMTSLSPSYNFTWRSSEANTLWREVTY